MLPFLNLFNIWKVEKMTQNALKNYNRNKKMELLCGVLCFVLFVCFFNLHFRRILKMRVYTCKYMGF